MCCNTGSCCASSAACECDFFVMCRGRPSAGMQQVMATQQSSQSNVGLPVTNRGGTYGQQHADNLNTYLPAHRPAIAATAKPGQPTHTPWYMVSSSSTRCVCCTLCFIAEDLSAAVLKREHACHNDGRQAVTCDLFKVLMMSVICRSRLVRVQLQLHKMQLAVLRRLKQHNAASSTPSHRVCLQCTAASSLLPYHDSPLANLQLSRSLSHHSRRHRTVQALSRWLKAHATTPLRDMHVPIQPAQPTAWQSQQDPWPRAQVLKVLQLRQLEACCSS